jgi:DNA-binding response OmpR family regulator
MTERILLIEDSPTQLLTIRKTLEAEGHVVLEAKTGAEGLVRAYNELPDLIISDVVMSGINGYQFCRLVKNDPDLSMIPMILLTKLDGSIDRFWGLKSGADRYIAKEPGFLNLTRAVRELLSESKTPQRLRVLSDPKYAPNTEEINNRLNQLLERLLFEATIIDEVRRIGEDILDLEVITEKLFSLLTSILSYQAAALVVNQGSQSILMIDYDSTISPQAIKGYVSKIALQLGLPPLQEELPRNITMLDNALTQPMDMPGLRLGLLIIVPHANQLYKPGDHKVVRLISEQLAIVLRLYQSHAQRMGQPVPT